MVQGSRLLHIAKMTGAAGMENHLLLLLPGLRERGLDVRLVVLTEPDKPMTAYLAEMNRRGVPAESMTVARSFDPALIRKLAGKLRSDGITAVHTHLIHADLHGWLAATLAGVKRIYSTAHNDDGFRKLLPVRLFQAFFWRQMTAGVAISEAVRQFLIHTEFAPASKIQTIHYGFDPTEIARDCWYSRKNSAPNWGFPPMRWYLAQYADWSSRRG
ncbi:MAG: glycosyltransferase [Anaerolineae bacterium]